MINNRYKIIRKLGAGRSSVYLCRDSEKSDKEIAIKILPSRVSEEEAESFRQEYFTLKKLDHPNIISAFDLGTVVKIEAEEDINIGSLFITLEFFKSEELINSALVGCEENLREIIKQICSVLYYLHQSKYIYYDLKPGNILITESDGKPFLKLIDLGLAEYSPPKSDYVVKGTAQYIAPELLRKEGHNHSVDLYSLGMMLYQLVYDRFPFDGKDEIEIYKEQIEKEFEFPSLDNFTSNFIDVLKKLLNKSPSERYLNALQVLSDLNIPLDIGIVKDFLPAKIFSDRDDVIKILTTYLNDKDSSEIFTIRGFDGAGKSAILNKLHELLPGSIFFDKIQNHIGIELIRKLFSQFFYSPLIYQELNENDKSSINELFDLHDNKFISVINSVVSSIATSTNVVLLIDDFNFLDDLSSEILRNLIPILQVNNAKIIITESSDKPYISDQLNNVRKVAIGPFTGNQLEGFIENSLQDGFPKEQLKKLILNYADLLPGNIFSFIKDLIILNIMQFQPTGVEFLDEGLELSNLKKAHFAVYDLRLKKLSGQQLNAARILSAFEIAIDIKTLAELMNVSYDNMDSMIDSMQVNNVIQNALPGNPLFLTSDGLKKHIYASIDNTKKLHSELADKISSELSGFSKVELARQYELAESYHRCNEVLQPEIREAEQHSAYSYLNKLLNYLLQLDLDEADKKKLRIKLCQVYFKLSDFQSVLNTISQLEKNELDEDEQLDLFILEGSSLINSGEIETGKSVIRNLISSIKEENRKQKLLVELAYADFEQNNFDEAYKQCTSVLKFDNLQPELKGRCHNLLGMYEIYTSNNLPSALTEFNLAINYYKEAELPRRVAGMEVNVGNIYNILGKFTEAESHWTKASEINQSIGNLDQEGILLLNFGIYYFERQNFEKAIESYNKAHTIFLSIGNKLNQGLVLSNTGEVYLNTCEYQKAFDSLIHAQKIFTGTKNFNELAEVFLILGKFYSRVGLINELGEIVDLFSILIEENDLVQKNHTNHNFLIQLLRFEKDEDLDEDILKSVSDSYKDLEERTNYLEAQFLLVEYLIRREKYESAAKELIKSEIIDLIKQNAILEAQREYLLGKISLHHAADQLLSPLEYFERAYELIQGASLNEYTWRILFALSEIYIERGNYNKAKNYIIYTRELIYFIAENMNKAKLKSAYLQKTERKLALEKLENYYE